MALLIVYVLVALGFSFLCSILEAVLLSLTPAFVAQISEEKPTRGAALAKLKADVDRPLAAILSLNTVAHTIGAAGAGAEAQRVFGSEWLAVASAVLTLLILIVSEIIPKTLGAIYRRQLAPATASILPKLMVFMSPLVWLSQGITLVLKRGHTEATISKDEIAALAKLSAEQGGMAESETRILRNLFRLHSIRVHDIMTPRTVTFALSADMTIGQFVRLQEEESIVFSRIPIYGDSRDDVLGYVLKGDLLLQAARDAFERPLRAFKRDMLVVPESLPVPAFFERLLDTREQIALVVDEYGGVDGVITMEDVLETLLGLEIVDEVDNVADLREAARRKWNERRALIAEPPQRTLADPESGALPLEASAESEAEPDASEESS